MIYLNNFVCISSIGTTVDEHIKSISTNTNHFSATSKLLPQGMEAFFGIIHEELPEISEKYYDCRTNRLIEYCLNNIEEEIKKCVSIYGKNRIGVVVGTSTGAIYDVENNVRENYKVEDETLDFDQRVYDIGLNSSYIKEKYNLEGPCYTIATACTSSARALISAKNLVDCGLCDVVIVAGVDSISTVSASGFYALGALSDKPCTPFAKDRTGITIGEACGITLLSKDKLDNDALSFLGFGASTDGHHVSAPEPSGVFAVQAMEDALRMANLSIDDIGYLNAHGTGTVLNDDMEYNAIKRLFGNKVKVSSSKHLSGHTLGAAGIFEAYIAKLILKHNCPLPYDVYDESDLEQYKDISLVVNKNEFIEKNIVMTNNFAFGGNNTSLIFA